MYHVNWKNELAKSVLAVRSALSNWRANSGRLACTRLCRNYWWWSQFLKISRNGRWKLVLYVRPTDEMVIQCMVECGSLKTSESQAIEIEDENTADRILWCERPASSQIHSSRTDGHFYSLFSSYGMTDAAHSSNLVRVSRTRQLEFAAWKCAGIHHNSSDTLLCRKSDHYLMPYRPPYQIRLWLTFFCFPKLIGSNGMPDVVSNM